MKQKIITVLAVLLGLAFINSGLNKFFNYMPPPKDLPAGLMKAFEAFIQIGWILPLVACGEILGGFLIIFRRTRALAGLILFPVMVGAVITNVLYYPQGIAFVLVIAAILLWIMFENRSKYLMLLG